MHIAIWSLLFAGILPVLTVAIAKWDRRYDNRDPRAFLERQAGLRRRADYAHRNHLEAFPFFAAGLLVAMLMKMPAGDINNLALLFVAARILYTVFYLTDRATLRSLAWMVGHGAVIVLFVRAAALAA